MARVRDELIPKVKAVCGYKEPSEARAAPPVGTILRAKSASRVPQFLNSASKLSPSAFPRAGLMRWRLMPGFPADFPVPIVIVQHMPPLFTRLLADRSSASSAIAIKEAAAGTELQPGAAWIAPGGFHMLLEKSAVGGAAPRLTKMRRKTLAVQRWIRFFVRWSSCRAWSVLLA